MLTERLERLIWEGKASFKTFTIGGSEKHILPVDKNSWIIITEILYFPQNNGILNDVDDSSDTLLTQLNVFSKKSFNSFVFRNELQFHDHAGQHFAFPGSPVPIDCYLIHEDNVSFSFAVGGALSPSLVGVSQDSATGNRGF